jgi:hypothetical protein
MNSERKRKALLIANDHYDDSELRQLLSPARDAEKIARVLQNPDFGDFIVDLRLNQPSHIIKVTIENFFSSNSIDDLLLLYFSGHGIKDEDGKLYFATIDTSRKYLRASSIESEFINDVMRRSRSKKQVLILDCCYSGAFAKGMVAKADEKIHIRDHFEGQGRVVLTASDSLQYSFERLNTGETTHCSVFSKSILKGIQNGEADLNGDGIITVDELYEYAFNRVIAENPNQKPGKWAFEAQGSIIISKNPEIRPAELPDDVKNLINNVLVKARLAAVDCLKDYLSGDDKRLMKAALIALEKLVNDDSKSVTEAALKVLRENKLYATPLEKKQEPSVLAVPQRQETIEEDIIITDPTHNRIAQKASENNTTAPSNVKSKEAHLPVKTIRERERHTPAFKPSKPSKIRLPLIIFCFSIIFISGILIYHFFFTRNEVALNTDVTFDSESLVINNNDDFDYRQTSVTIDKVYTYSLSDLTIKAGQSYTFIINEFYNNYKALNKIPQYIEINCKGSHRRFGSVLYEVMPVKMDIILDFASSVIFMKNLEGTNYPQMRLIFNGDYYNDLGILESDKWIKLDFSSFRNIQNQSFSDLSPSSLQLRSNSSVGTIFYDYFSMENLTASQLTFNHEPYYEYFYFKNLSTNDYGNCWICLNKEYFFNFNLPANNDININESDLIKGGNSRFYGIPENLTFTCTYPNLAMEGALSIGYYYASK